MKLHILYGNIANVIYESAMVKAKGLAPTPAAIILTMDALDYLRPLITRFMGPTWGPPGSCRPQVGPM